MSIKKEKQLFLPDLQYCQFQQDGWKNNFFRKSNLNMKFKYLEKLQFFRYLKLKSAAILNDVK